MAGSLIETGHFPFLDRSFSANDMHYDREDREQQKQVNQNSCGLKDEETRDPDHKQDNRYDKKHPRFPFWVRTLCLTK